MPGSRDLLLGVLLPAILCGLALLVGRGLVDRAGRALAGIAFGVAWLAAYAGLFGLPALPSSEVTPSARDWLAWIVLAATLLGLVPERSVAALIRIVLSAALAWLSVGGWIEMAAAFVLLLASWTSVEALCRRIGGPTMPLVLLPVAVATSFANLFTHSGLIAQLAGAMAACLGASAVVAFTDRRFHLRPAAVAVILLVLGGCLLNGRFHSDLPTSSALLLVGSFFAPWLAELPALGGGGAWKRIGLAALPAAAAVALAWSPSEGVY